MQNLLDEQARSAAGQQVPRWMSFRGARPSDRTTEWLVLGLVVVAAIASVAMYWRFVGYNLPASSHVDERRGLGVLLRFHEGTLNPGFFYYPTLLYYIVFAIGEALGGPQVYLVVGRAVTILAGAALGVAAFWLVRLMTESRPAALLAATLMLFNPILADSASYMSTDLLTALFVTIALGCYLTAVRDASAAAWILAFAFAGLATSAKYNAAILVLALMLSDLVRATPAFPVRARAGSVLNASLPAAPVRAVLAALGMTLILVATLTPMDFFVGMLRSSAELNSVVDRADIEFIQNRLRWIAVTGGLLLGYVGLTLLRPPLLDPFRRVRIFIGPAIALLAFALTTPFAVLSFTKFVYDFGSQLKALEMEGGDGRQWLAYPRFFRDAFGWVVSALTIVGLIVLRSIRTRRMLVPLLLFLGLYGLIISSSTLAFPRYMLAILPVLLGCAAWGLVLAARRARRVHVALAALLVAVVGLASVRAPGTGVANVLARADQVDEWHTALQRVRQIDPAVVYFAGFVPDVELRMAGYDVREVAEAVIRATGVPDEDGSESAVLLIDDTTRRTANLEGAVLLWADSARIRSVPVRLAAWASARFSRSAHAGRDAHSDSFTGWSVDVRNPAGGAVTGRHMEEGTVWHG